MGWSRSGNNVDREQMGGGAAHGVYRTGTVRYFADMHGQSPSLELGFIGNCAISALIDAAGRIVWSSFPRFDGDPVFDQLLDTGGDRGFFEVELVDCVQSEQRYLPNTAVLSTRLSDSRGAGIEIIDFAPRFPLFGRMFRPMMLVRLVTPFGEAPRIRIRLRPGFAWGRTRPTITRGSNYIRYVDDTVSLRLTTNAPLTYVPDETAFYLEGPVGLILGPDESLTSGVVETARHFLDETIQYWQSLVRRLHLPFDWQEAVIRSAITLKLCSFEETGAVIAAPTSSLPEADGEGRNWDYRYCWLRDAFFVVRALNRLGYIETMEGYIDYLANIVANSRDGYLQPVYGIGLETRLPEREIDWLTGFRGNRPIRVGNQAYEHDQHDGYGSVVLAATQAFFDQRLRRPAGPRTFALLERLGEKAWEYHAKPDAGLWEFRTKARVHTHSSVMCWAACDRLARVATHLGLCERAQLWAARAAEIRKVIETRAWNPAKRSFVASFGGEEIDASLLLLLEVGFLKPDDPRFAATVAAVERELADGPFIHRYASNDDFGRPRNAFLACTFWYIDALTALGRQEEARERFEEVLRCRNRLGLLAEHVDPRSRALFGNFPQTYSHVGLVNNAMRLSRRWDAIV